MQKEDRESVSPPRIRRGRLQREPTASGYRVETFRDVVVRHGGVMGGFAGLCLMTPGAFSAIDAGLLKFTLEPTQYAIGLLALLAFFVLWSRRRSVAAVRQCQWIAYLLFISIVEEIGFRVIFPALMVDPFGWLAANIISNLAFAAIHYVTLRWQLKNCVVTFLGGMGLSYLMSGGDLVLVVMVHWVGTFLNTPFSPSGPRK